MWIFIISFALGAPALSFAEESNCARIYRGQHAIYSTSMEELKSLRTTMTEGSGVAAAALGICLLKTRSIVGCVALFGVALAGSQAYRLTISNDIQKLEDAHDVYEIYYDITRENYGSENLKGLFRTLGSSVSQEHAVAGELARMMDSGELCKNGVPGRSFEETLHILKERQSQL